MNFEQEVKLFAFDIELLAQSRPHAPALPLFFKITGKRIFYIEVDKVYLLTQAITSFTHGTEEGLRR